VDAPANFDPTMRQLGGGQPHNRPRPKRPKEPDQCTGTVTRIVLGNEFRSDVAAFRLALPGRWQLDPDKPSTTIGARSAVEALRRAACLLEDLEPNDIDGDFRFAPSDGTRPSSIFAFTIRRWAARASSKRRRKTRSA
jgi:hypothetical protein